jgi:hypothetical protein
MSASVFKKYYSMSNLIVRVSPADNPAAKENALLVNSHLDSTLPSPGAADDGLGVGIMLELLRLYTSQETPTVGPLRHALVLLFNNGEESLQDGEQLSVSRLRFERHSCLRYSVASVHHAARAYAWLDPRRRQPRGVRRVWPGAALPSLVRGALARLRAGTPAVRHRAGQVSAPRRRDACARLTLGDHCEATSSDRASFLATLTRACSRSTATSRCSTWPSSAAGEAHLDRNAPSSG